ncbi:MAG: cation diffusion facilitator family transporter [Butyrivibrio sp.]|nr:cation diffusion facilitator family transporter [Butyrivibrio sp.]
MASANATKEKSIDLEKLDLDDLERQLEEGFGEDIDRELAERLAELDFIDEQKAQIANPDMLGQVVLNTVWDQFTNQVAIQAGEDFIKSNNGLRLDLSDDAHIQTTENFADGKIASHNTEIDYQKRYDEWQSNFQKDESGNVVTHTTRTGKEEATLVKGARAPFDENRPKGSKENHTDMDHTVSATEIIRDAEANAHMTKEEQIAFANSKENLNEMDSSLNRSKGDKSMSDWLDNPNANGQKPDEIFDISEADEQRLREKDEEARAEYEKQKKEAEERSIKAGKKSQKAEALRVGKKAARAIIMNLLAELVKKIIQKFVAWLKSSNKNLKSLLTSIKDAIIAFVIDLKTQVVSVLDTAVTVIASSIIGPVFGVIKKAWMFIKQGWKSLKEAVDYIRDPKNKGQSVEIMMMEVGKIVMAGLTAGGAIVLGEVIEAGLTTIPIFAIEIPLFGSLANIIGIFMGAVVAGIIGALAIDLINRLIAKKQKQMLEAERIDKANAVLATQDKIIARDIDKLNSEKEDISSSISNRHKEAGKIMKEALDNIVNNDGESNDEELRTIRKRLDSLAKEE